MTKPAPTLIDTLYRATFRNTPMPGWRSNAALRELLTKARRFKLDTAMSAFLGELGTQAFVPLKGTRVRNVGLMSRQVESLRVSARAPHAVTWIEYALRPAMARSNELLGRPYNPQQSPETEGWLIEQHGGSAFRMHIFTWVTNPMEFDIDGSDVWTFPVAYTWTVDGMQPPWPSLFRRPNQGEPGEWDSGLATGILGYQSNGVSIAQSELMQSVRRFKTDGLVDLVREWVGVVRRTWALLATLNDIPIIKHDVRASKGFVAKGRYRRFLDHSTITLTVPQKEQTKIARQLIALVRRRAHQVRGHFRDDWRHPPSKTCQHQWMAALDGAGRYCEQCHGHQSWISEHQRGDASLGFITHDYNVKHETDHARC